MRKLQPLEHDALTELFNIGLHRAAASLSDVAGQRIVMDAPRLWACSIDEIQGQLAGLVEGDLATVHQIFGGKVAGDAVLLLEYDKAALLTGELTHGEVGLGGQLDQSAREVLAEVGNIVLSACLSAFGDILKVAVTFSVPRMRVESVEELIRSIVIGEEELQLALIAATRFQLSQLEVGGYLIFVLGLTSLSWMTGSLLRNIADPEGGPADG